MNVLFINYPISSNFLKNQCGPSWSLSSLLAWVLPAIALSHSQSFPILVGLYLFFRQAQSTQNLVLGLQIETSLWRKLAKLLQFSDN